MKLVLVLCLATVHFHSNSKSNCAESYEGSCTPSDHVTVCGRRDVVSNPLEFETGVAWQAGCPPRALTSVWYALYSPYNLPTLCLACCELLILAPAGRLDASTLARR